MDFKREFSAGCVVYRREKSESKDAKKARIEFLLGKHSGYHKWVLPKGLIEAREKGWQTALRETAEEVGVKAKLVFGKPIHVIKYIYAADLKNQPQISNSQFLISKQISNFKPSSSKQDKATRRVKKYQENGGNKVRVFKTVSFYLAKFESGKPEDHGWEMEDAGWYSFVKAKKLMAFKGEKQALQKAKIKLAELAKQTSLF
jgi:8-oxo-dGTP pyrophosphatase MutT (NUDIX family)